MNEQKTGNREKGTDALARRLRNALPPVGDQSGAAGDLWPAMQRKLRSESAIEPVRVPVPWFDWALAGGLALLLAAFPGWIPVLLYYL
jgi:hypothetical protein